MRHERRRLHQSTLPLHLTLLFFQSNLKAKNTIIARPLPFCDVNEDGSLSPPICLHEEESFHWEEDENGYTLIDDLNFHPVSGRRRVYADRDSRDELISSGIVFGQNIKLNKVQTKRLNRLKKHLKPPERIRRWQCDKNPGV